MAQFGQVVDELLEETWRHDPVGATRIGIHRYDHLLTDNSPEAMEAWGQKLRDFRRQFEAINSATLTHDEQLDRLWGLAVLDRSLVDHDLRYWERAPRYYLEGIGSGLQDLLIGEFAPIEERMSALLSRLKAVPAFLDMARLNLKPEAVPRLWIEYDLLTAQSMQQFIAEAVRQAALQVPAMQGKMVKVSQVAAQAIADFEAFIRDLGSRAQGNFAIGRERFDFILKRCHLLDMDSQDLYELARDWIARYERELAEVARRIDPNRSWPEVLESIKDHHPAAEQLRQAYEDETMIARHHCLEHELINLPEGENCSVEWTPPFLRAAFPLTLAWISPAFESGLSGKWYITPVDPDAPPEQQCQHLRRHSWARIRSSTMHMIYPGHHLHAIIAKRVSTPLRLQFWNFVFLEGWGEYTEELFYETGFLTDPPLRLMQLSNGLARAVGIVIDTGLHARGMTPDEADRWQFERARLEPRWAASGTHFYTTAPTHASSYRVGPAMIMNLREKYKAKKGSAFRLKEFHDRLLSYSTLPLKIVQQEMLSSTEC
jgi:uncharacterized protein (DUF885 family)